MNITGKCRRARFALARLGTARYAGAILCGCLLVKPDMRHVETAPDIFIPRITYVPVKWDYSNLPEVCAHYLTHPEERQRIVDRAYAVVMESQTAEWFVERFEAVMMKSADRVAIRT